MFTHHKCHRSRSGNQTYPIPYWKKTDRKASLLEKNGQIEGSKYPLMEKNGQFGLLTFADGSKGQRRLVRAGLDAGVLRTLHPGIYTTDLETDSAQLVRQHWHSILAYLFPNAVISHRTGLEVKPTAEGDVFLTYKYTKTIALPGLKVHLLAGPGPHPDDKPFGDKPIYFASEARAILENLQTSRKRSTVDKSVPIAEIEDRLVTILHVRGEDGLNKFRDQGKQVANDLGFDKEWTKLSKIIAALLTTAPVKGLTSKLALAHISGLPYDPGRKSLFENLFNALSQTVFPDRVGNVEGTRPYFDLAFFEAYFSNFIEGTIFKVEEAHQIITENQPIYGRHADSHDILSTYHLVSDRAEIAITPTSGEHLLDILARRHKVLLQERPDKLPGVWKTFGNQAGDTIFVEPHFVKGTLIMGFDYYAALAHPLAKATMMMFLVSEVHPFNDGNGRLARIMMNAELSKAGLTRIVITTNKRKDYLRALRKLSRQNDPKLFIRLMDTAQAEMASLQSLTYIDLLNKLIGLEAFDEEGEGILF